METFGFAQFLITSVRGSFLCKCLIAKALTYVLPIFKRYNLTHSIFTFYNEQLFLIIGLSVFWRYEDGQVGDANINTQDIRIQKVLLRVIGGQSTWLLHHCDALKHLRTIELNMRRNYLKLDVCLFKKKTFCNILISILLTISNLVSIYVMFAALLMLCHEKSLLSLN